MQAPTTDVPDAPTTARPPNAAPPRERRNDTAPKPSEASETTPRPIPAFVRLRIAFVRGFLSGYARLFGLSALYRLGRFFGLLEYVCDYNRRRRVRGKLQSLFGNDLPPAVLRRHVLRYFMRARCDKIFFTIMDRIPRGKLMNRIKLKGRHHMDDALARGNGLYIALCHYGAHHVAGLMAALLGYRIAGVRDAKESHVRRYIYQKYRETWPEVAAMQLVYSNTFPRVLFRYLKDNHIVASLLDVDRQRGENLKTQTVRFFGQQRQFLTGPVQMAARCGSVMIQGFIVSRRNFYYQLIATPPLIDPDEAAKMTEDQVLSVVLQRYADGVEQYVRDHPDHLVNF